GGFRRPQIGKATTAAHGGKRSLAGAGTGAGFRENGEVRDDLRVGEDDEGKDGIATRDIGDGYRARPWAEARGSGSALARTRLGRPEVGVAAAAAGGGHRGLADAFIPAQAV